MKSQRELLPSALVVLLASALLYWAFKDIPIADIAQILGRLSALQIITLLIVNTLIMFLFGLRWWMILKEMGHDIPLFNIALYRLAAFGVSYFTPGPQFGGEPLQVIFIRNKHQVETSQAIASVSFDKLIELISNFSFLLIAFAIVIRSELMVNWNYAELQVLAIFLLLLPLMYFGSLYWGYMPIAFITRRLKISWQKKVEDSEKQLYHLVRNKNKVLLLSLGASLLVWLALIYEYQLALSFLGADIPLTSILAIMLLARLAMLAPTPGALGALEASLVFSVTALNLAPALGISLGLIIRGRDILFGGIGILLGWSQRHRE